MTKFHVGTSGWHYKHWRGSFYPAELSASEWLSFYAREFATVELNNSFYRLPAPAAWRLWKETAPPGFTFAVKASRYITHMKRLGGGADPNQRVLSGARMLGNHLGPVLYQLPPTFVRTDETTDRLRDFLGILPTDLHHVFEFRHPSWFTEPTFSLLDNFKAHFCAFDMPGIDCPLRVTGGLLYFRFHGTDGAYTGGYTDADLGQWANRFKKLTDRTEHAYVYFNNDIGGFAPRNARTLRAILEEPAPALHSAAH